MSERIIFRTTPDLAKNIVVKSQEVLDAGGKIPLNRQDGENIGRLQSVRAVDGNVYGTFEVKRDV